MIERINIGKYIEIAINWLTENFASFFDALNTGMVVLLTVFKPY